MVNKETTAMPVGSANSTKRAMRNRAIAAIATVAAAGLCAFASPASAAPSLSVEIDNDAHELQRVAVNATGGEFKLSFDGDTSSDLPTGVTPAAMQDALNALPSISSGGGSVSVEVNTLGSGKEEYWVTFDGGPLAHSDVPQLQVVLGATPLTGHSARVTTSTMARAGVSRTDRRVDYGVVVTNDGPDPTSGPVTVEVAVPGGLETFVLRVAHGPLGADGGWSCSESPAAGVQPATATCTRSDELAAGASYPALDVQVALGPDAPAHAVATAEVSGGGGAAQAADGDEFDFRPEQLFDISTFDTAAYGFNGSDYTQAGGHPFAAGASIQLSRYRVVGDLAELNPNYRYGPIEPVKNIIAELPDGFAGNAVSPPELCPGLTAVLEGTCPPASVVGGVNIDLSGTGTGLGPLALYAIQPEPGRPAQFGFAEGQTQTTYSVAPRLRADPDGGYTVTVESVPIPLFPTTYGVESVTLCGFGAANTKPQGGGLATRILDGCRKADDPAANPVPFLTLPPHCDEQPPTTKLAAESWENPGVFTTAESVDPALAGCDQVEFSPDVSLTPTSTGVDSAGGLNAELSFDSEGVTSADGVAQAHLKKTVVELPEGVAVNPSAATGLAGCSDAQLGLGNDNEPSCPGESKIGSVTATTPILEETLSGEMVLRTPRSTDPMSGDMLRTALVVRNRERGILVKLPGTTTADPETGRLTATFDDNPELPIADVAVKVKGGEKGVLAMPQACGEKEIDTELSPWKGDANTNANAADFSDPFTVGGDCSFGFAPKLAAGMSTQAARATGDFSFRFSREDGEQWLDGLTAKLPQGLLATVREVPLCSPADAEAGTCGAGSRVGTVDASAGSGDPFVLERKGDAYLTEGYKGCAYGLMVKVPVVAGPFDKSSPETDLGDIVVRQALCVDPKTAEVTAISDPFPTIWHGIPLRARSVTVKVDRAGFMLNPSDCTAKRIDARFHSLPGNTADAGVPFQASGCSALPYKPRIGLRVTGKRQLTTGKHPGVRALVRQNGVGEAGIEKTVVRLPKSLALDPENAQALCEFVDGTKPDLDKRCPKGSIVGRARATSPLLNGPLVGNVYFVKNVRIDPTTGNQIRTLPMIVVALRGEVAINLVGESSTTNSGKLVNTFDEVPDAPISQFNLNIAGGKNGILAVTRTRRAKINLCASRQIAEADTDGQNGRRRDFDIRIKTPCTKQQVKKAKRAAKRA